MSDNMNNEQLRDLVSDSNTRDTNLILRLFDRFSNDEGFLGQSIGEYRERLGLGAYGARYGEKIDLDSLDFYQTGAQTFIQVLREHPAFYEERNLSAGAPILGDNYDPFLSELGRDVSELLVAGAVAIGILGDTDERYMVALMHVAFNADAISNLLRTVLSAKPIPQIDDLFHIPEQLQNLYQNTCVLGVEHALADFWMAVASNTATSWSTGIKMLQPNNGCAGDQVVIHGSGFGLNQPNNVEVWFPTVQGQCAKAQVVPPWSDNKIVVIAPANTGNGCIGFVRLPSNPIPFAVPADNLAGEMEQCFGKAAFGATQVIREIGAYGFLIPCPPCLANGANYFKGGLPIASFSINGSTALTVQPNTVLSLNWQVINASTVRIRRTSTMGPHIDVTNPLSQPINLGPFIGNSAVDATYELTATNSCGSINRTVTVKLRTDPVLSITGIEVVQAIQRPDNSVRLVAGKRTIVRVFVDSGINNGFNNGAGPNLMPNVTGAITSFPLGANQGFSAGPPIIFIDGINTGGSVTARPAASINRNLGIHSLNFELPLNITSGTVRIDVRVWVKGHESDVGGPWRAFGSTTVTFSSQPSQEVLPFLIADPLLGLPAPTLAQYNTSLQGARTRYPISQNGFIVNPSQMYSTVVGIRFRDLTTVLGFAQLLTDITTMIFIFPTTPVGGIRTAIVPNDPRYAVNGMGVPRVAVTVPAFIAQAAAAGASGLDPFAGTFAHEMGHSFGLGHAPACFTPSLFDPIDTRLPGGTEDVGMEVPTRTVIPSGQGEIMSYNGDLSRCPGRPRWPSIASWDIIFNSLPI